MEALSAKEQVRNANDRSPLLSTLLLLPPPLPPKGLTSLLKLPPSRPEVKRREKKRSMACDFSPFLSFHRSY